jgi:hypothetical protein
MYRDSNKVLFYVGFKIDPERICLCCYVTATRTYREAQHDNVPVLITYDTQLMFLCSCLYWWSSHWIWNIHAVVLDSEQICSRFTELSKWFVDVIPVAGSNYLEQGWREVWMGNRTRLKDNSWQIYSGTLKQENCRIWRSYTHLKFKNWN